MVANLNFSNNEANYEKITGYFLQEFCGQFEGAESEQGLLVRVVDPALADVGCSVV